jgi:hypothetical protein
MDTDKLIQFFSIKLEKIPELTRLSHHKDPEFTAWWNTIKATCERMGKTYADRAQKIRLYPGMTIMGADNSAAYASAYQKGLKDIEAFLRSLIEELETWGFDGIAASPKRKGSASEKDSKVILNLTVSQQQIQEITQTINLSQYDAQVQEKVEELLAELKKPTKNKSKIIDSVKWLADKGSDALIAILLASAHLTT